MNANLMFKDANDSNVSCGLSVVPLTPYFLTVNRDETNSEFHWTLLNLSNGQETTSTTVIGAAHTNLQTNLKIGSAQCNFSWIFSDFFMYNNPSATRTTMIKNYVQNKYGATEEQSENEVNAVVHNEKLFFEMRVE